MVADDYDKGLCTRKREGGLTQKEKQAGVRAETSRQDEREGGT